MGNDDLEIPQPPESRHRAPHDREQGMTPMDRFFFGVFTADLRSPDVRGFDAALGAIGLISVAWFEDPAWKIAMMVFGVASLASAWFCPWHHLREWVRGHFVKRRSGSA